MGVHIPLLYYLLVFLFPHVLAPFISQTALLYLPRVCLCLLLALTLRYMCVPGSLCFVSVSCFQEMGRLLSPSLGLPLQNATDCVA